MSYTEVVKMQPYPNPNYYAQYTQPQPQFNPYMQRMENLQHFQQALQQPTVTSQVPALGKVVESMDIVKVTDIPMDGNVYYFPKADGEEIYTKQFLPNGQTRILTFKPLSDAEPNNSADKDLKSQIALSDELTEAFMKRFDDLEKRFDELTAKKPATSRAKKESAEDE
jgi:hypothetical protein